MVRFGQRDMHTEEINTYIEIDRTMGVKQSGGRRRTSYTYRRDKDIRTSK